MTMIKSSVMDYTSKIQRCHEYVEALEVEQKKIHVFQRELPLCLQLVNQAIESCRKELLELSTSESECSERTKSESVGVVAVFEEFIPVKGTSSSSNKDEGCESGDKKKSDWLRSVQLWNHSSDPLSKEDKTTLVNEVKRNGAFHPFQKEKARVATKTDSHLLNVITPTTTTSSSTVETVGNKREMEQQKQSQMSRKQRRCWSPELHRRFLHALKQLGGSHVATPKQIRDYMKVDGLTNDEVKSHLQKYRLHTKITNGRENPQQTQYMVVEGIWVPSQDVGNTRVYAPVAAHPPKSSGERSRGRCKSPATSSTHTPQLLPLS